MDPITTLQFWLQRQTNGFLINVGTDTDVPVGPDDWRVSVGHLAYLHVHGDRVHVIHVVKATEADEQVEVEAEGGLHLTFSYWWTPEQRATLEAWQKARVPLDVPTLLQLALPESVT